MKRLRKEDLEVHITGAIETDDGSYILKVVPNCLLNVGDMLTSIDKRIVGRISEIYLNSNLKVKRPSLFPGEEGFIKLEGFNFVFNQDRILYKTCKYNRFGNPLREQEEAVGLIDPIYREVYDELKKKVDDINKRNIPEDRKLALVKSEVNRAALSFRNKIEKIKREFGKEEDISKYLNSFSLFINMFNKPSSPSK